MLPIKEWPVSDQHERGNLKACDLEPNGLQLSPLWAHAKKNPLLRDERPENTRALASAEILGARCVKPAPLASDSLLHLRCLADPHMSGRHHTRGGHHALCRLLVRCRCAWVWLAASQDLHVQARRAYALRQDCSPGENPAVLAAMQRWAGQQPGRPAFVLRALSQLESLAP